MGDRRRRWKGGNVGNSTIVTIELPATLPPPSHGFAVPAPLDKGGREGSALNRRSTTLRTTQSLLPPLAKGRTVRGTVRCNPGAATINHGGPPKAVEGWKRSKEHYRNDRGNLRRLHPSVSFADSPPWQGGPRGLCGAAAIVQPCQRGRASCLPLLRGGGICEANDGRVETSQKALL